MRKPTKMHKKEGIKNSVYVEFSTLKNKSSRIKLFQVLFFLIFDLDKRILDISIDIHQLPLQPPSSNPGLNEHKSMSSESTHAQEVLE